MNETERDTTPIGYLTYAESYGRAAFVVSNAIDNGTARMAWPVPVGTLALHCVELSLKSVLIQNGMTPDEVRKKHGHDIEEMFAATALDWSDIDVEHIEFYSDAVLNQTLRYRRKDIPYYHVDKDHVLPFMEKVFHRCLAHVSPAAKRTLRVPMG